MTARPQFVERLLAAEQVRDAREVDAMALAKLRALTLTIASAALEAEQLAKAIPTAEVNPLHFQAMRSLAGRVYHESELALCALPLDVVAP